jgi:geranylgeranyl reductase
MQVIVAGGGPSGAIAAGTLAANGIRAILFEKNLTNDKTCAGGIPSALVNDFNLPDEIIHQKCRKVRFKGPSGVEVLLDFPPGGYLATVRRNEFDSFLRKQAEDRGVIIEQNEVFSFEETSEGIKVNYKDTDKRDLWAKADYLIGADGAVSRIARLLRTSRLEYITSMQEYIRPNPDGLAHWNEVAELHYSSDVSPDYYGWIFPHRNYVSIGVGTHYDNAKKISEYLERIKKLNSKWLDGGETLGKGAAQIPSTAYRDPARGKIFLVGDSAGFVLPGCGEGIYYAMKSGQFAAEAIIESHRMGHSNPAHIYNRRCEHEFSPTFRYFKRVEKLAFKNDFTRELFIRYCEVPNAADNFLNVFSLKKRKSHSTPASKIKRAIALNKIRNEIKKEGLFKNSGS